MKKHILLASIFFSLNSIAQSTTPNEALSLTNNDLNGTARYNSMGGAFGAVGGDLSAIGINPAGSLFFKYNTASFSLKYNNNNNKATYLGNTENKKSNHLDINQAGVVFAFSNPENSISKIAISVNYENKSNFKNKYHFYGLSSNSGVDQYFLDYANGTNGIGVFPINYATDYNFSDFGNFADQQAWLGYNSYILDYDNTNGEYYTNIPTGVDHYQRKTVNQRGINSKLQFNLAGAIKDKLFLGINLNAHITDLEKTFVINERNYGLYSSGISVNETTFENNVYTSGGGFNLDLGAIYKITDNFRLGLSYASPTWYKLTDEVQQGIYTLRTDAADPNTFTGNSLYPNSVTIFDSYNLRTPSKFTGSFAGIIGGNWLISADASISDHSNTKYTTNGFENLNTYFKNTLDTAYEYRVGTEYIIKNVALRVGYRFVESPYKDKNLAPVGDTKTITAGIGYNFGISKLDLSYANTDRNFSEDYISNNWQNSANIKNKNNAFTLTYTVSF